MHGFKLAKALSTCLFVAALAAAPALAADQSIWSDVSEAQIVTQGERWIVPERYRTVALDQTALAAVLQAAPLEGSANAPVANVILALPLPGGEYGRFRIEESPIMAPELAARYPELRTYRGRGIDDPTAMVRFDLTPAGFHAMIRSVGGTVYIDPFSRGDVTHYVSYFKRDYSNPEIAEHLRCLVTGERPGHERPGPLTSASTEGAPNLPNGETLKTYRTVVAATGEYTTFHGGTVWRNRVWRAGGEPR